MKAFPKLINQFFVWLQTNDIKGKYKFFLLSQKLFNNFYIKHHSAVGDFCVPYSQWCFWSTLGPDQYYLDESLPFCKFINTHLQEFTFVDLGADVGVFSHLISLHCPSLKNIYAVEPNPLSYHLLAQNAAHSSVPFNTYNVAISNYNGFADLQYDASSYSDHEGHITTNSKGNTKVTKLDDLLATTIDTKHLVVKVDVEGQEQAVLEGANHLLTQCEKAVLLIEIHPDTLNSHGLTAEDIFSTLEQVRDVSWFVPLLNKKIDRKQGFFNQFPLQQYDVIGFIES